MWLIVGLGNPGDKYHNNRHNIGFLCVDEYLSHTTHSQISNPQFKSLTYKTQEAILSQPQTYMNASGESVQAIASYYKIDPEHIVVIHDDLDLGFGVIKFKRGGGHGGHNGLRSIDQHIGRDYLRIRVGIGRPEHKSDVSNYVLRDFSKEEQSHLEELYQHVKVVLDTFQKGDELSVIQSRLTKAGVTL
jgi:PTH1 family peptidyl-tRNA hydrolase